MAHYLEDEAREVRLAAADDDITPLEGVRSPRGKAQRGSVTVMLDSVAGMYEASNKPTPDPPDFAGKRVPKWAGRFSTLKGD